MLVGIRCVRFVRTRHFSCVGQSNKELRTLGRYSTKQVLVFPTLSRVGKAKISAHIFALVHVAQRGSNEDIAICPHRMMYLSFRRLC